jgi:hypothetical protein
VERRGDIPDVLAYKLADAVRLAEECGFRVSRRETAPPRGAGRGPLRVVRQQLAEDGQMLELTVTAEDWGKEV